MNPSSGTILSGIYINTEKLIQILKLKIIFFSVSQQSKQISVKKNSSFQFIPSNFLSKPNESQSTSNKIDFHCIFKLFNMCFFYLQIPLQRFWFV